VTHEDLVDIGRRWLAAAKSSPSYPKPTWTHGACHVVLTEVAALAEIPDVIGWSGDKSILIECKTSVSDFKADAKKAFRAPGKGLGAVRMFLTPVGLLAGQVLPGGWGLLETNGKTVRVVTEGLTFEPDLAGERRLLLNTLLRVKIVPDKSVSLRTYEMVTKNRATLTTVIDAQS